MRRFVTTRRGPAPGELGEVARPEHASLCHVLDVVYEHDDADRVGWAAALQKAAGMGVSSVGSVGDVVDPESRRHEVIDPPVRGQCVVRRPGYEWTSGEETLVVLRALVTNG